MLAEHFFRHEYANLVATLSRKVGVQHLALIEDAVQTSFMKATERWRTEQPINPQAWLHRVAFNALIDAFRKQKPLTDLNILEEHTLGAEETVSDTQLDDDFLHLIFVCCDQAIPQASSLVVVLKVLCGFSVKEIALRLFISEENVYKRYQRARNVLRKKAEYFNQLSYQDSAERLDTALNVLYLLFTEGYLSYSQDHALRIELCEESMRLTSLLSEKLIDHKPTIMALLALMSFNMARVQSRQNSVGELLLLAEQDRRLWNTQLIQQGFQLLAKSAQGEVLSRYHLEAAIAAEHCRAASIEETNWQAICHYYLQLENLHASFLYRLNRAVALAEWQGPAEGLALLLTNTPPTWMHQSYLWLTVAADLYARNEQDDEAERYTALAIKCAPTSAIKQLIKRRMQSYLKA